MLTDDEVNKLSIPQLRHEHEYARIKIRDWTKELMKIKARLQVWHAYKRLVTERLEKLLKEKEGENAKVTFAATKAAATSRHATANEQRYAEAYTAEMQAEIEADRSRHTAEAATTAREREAAIADIEATAFGGAITGKASRAKAGKHRS